MVRKTIGKNDYIYIYEWYKKYESLKDYINRQVSKKGQHIGHLMWEFFIEEMYKDGYININTGVCTYSKYAISIMSSISRMKHISCARYKLHRTVKELFKYRH